MEQLDALRAIAVAAVFAQHALMSTAAVRVVGPGRHGVILFFVLSGYLITGILLRCRDLMAEGQALATTLRQFYARRFLRITPLLYLVLSVAAVSDIQPVRETFWWHVTYLSNFYFVTRGDWNGPITPFWTLAIEEQFYLVWPLVVLLMPRAHLRATIVGLIVLCGLARVAFVCLGGTTFAVGMLPFGSSDYLILGALLAELQSRGAKSAPTRRRLGRLGIAIGLPLQALVLGIVPAPVPDWWARSVPWLDLTVTHAALGLACFWLVDRASTGFTGPAGRLLSLAPLRWVGKVSYGIYVWHMFVIVGLASLIARLTRDHPAWQPTTDLTWLPWRLTAVLVVAALSWRWFEQPINALKRHFPYCCADVAQSGNFGDFGKAGSMRSHGWAREV